MKIKFLLPIVAVCFMVSCGPAPSTIADELVGTYVGMYQTSSITEANFSITVTKTGDDEVQFAPTNGATSATFLALLTDEMSGTISTIKIFVPSDIIENNGTFVPSTGKLSYTFHLGGDEDHNLEIFIGDKQ